jgi:hypothetical protein
MMFPAVFFVLAFCLQYVVADVTILNTVQVIYDRSPKIRIRGSGFADVAAEDISLDLGAANQPPLMVDTDYTITKDSDGDSLVLKLTPDRRFVF